MGPLLYLVSPCFRENVVVTQIWVFLCSLDNLLQKNVIVFFLKIKFQNGAHLKKAIFDILFTFFSYQRKVNKNNFSAYLTYMYFAHPIDFFALPILKKY